MVLTAAAHAKINLGLNVLRKRPDGYHDIDTVFLRVGWCDRVVVRAGEQLSFGTSEETLSTGEDNLCLRAARSLERLIGPGTGADIFLEKHLPAGAGLGGGSSDAATTLQLLNDLWELHVRPARLEEIGATLGSDVPFFLNPCCAAHGTGRGDEIECMQGYDFPFFLVIAVPDQRISTAWAYGEVAAHDLPDKGRLPNLVRSNDLQVWRDRLTNDFEEVVFDRFPEIRAIRDRLYEHGAGYASLSGSGSAVFGVFEDRLAAERAGRVEADSGTVWVGRAAAN